jgi:uncharacterized membrane protein YraQ (UPF0718 family)
VADILNFIINFSAILWEAMPFVILGAVIAGILEELLPQQWLTKLLPKSVLPAVMIGGVLGLLFPMCECGIVVVMRRLLRKGLPLSSCIAYMLAGPIVNVVVITSTWVAFRDHKIGPEMVGLRVGLGFLVAVVTGLIVHRSYKKYGNNLLTPTAAPSTLPMADETEAKAEKKTPFQRLGNISATAIHDFVDIMVFLIAGAAIAAFVKLHITPGQIQYMSKEQPYLTIPAMMGLSFLMCLCSEADAFVAASFTSMHHSAKLAFLVLGPMLDIKLVLMYTRVFRLRLILTIVVCVVVQVLAYCIILHAIYDANGWSGLPPKAITG